MLQGFVGYTVHRNWLGELYAWAGQYRTVELQKDNFAWPPAWRVSDNLAIFEREMLGRFTPCRPGPLAQVADAMAHIHAELLLIHPFRDGNGRMARLLTNLMLLRCGYAFCMYSSHEKVVEDNKEAYYIALRQTQATLKGNADLNPWFLFFLSALEQQVNTLRAHTTFKHAGTLTLLSEKVVDLIRVHQPASIGFLQRASGIKRATLKAILARLKKDGTITMDGSKKGSSYRIR